MRKVAKGVIEGALIAAGAPRWMIARRAPITAVLAYHNVVPTGGGSAGDASLHIPQRQFAEHLDRLLETHDIVPLSQAFEQVEPEARPRAVVTFDDAYHGAVTAGLEELGKRGVPSTIFVCPGHLGGEGFWWDRLSPSGSALDHDVRDHALYRLGGRHTEVLDWASERGIPIANLPEHARPARESTLLAAASSGLVTLGSHTWSHPNITAIDRSELAEELTRTAQWLEGRSVPSVSWLAYPYGLHDPPSASVCRRYVEGALRVDGGLAQSGGKGPDDMYRVPRINVPAGLSSAGLALRISGFGD